MLGLMGYEELAARALQAGVPIDRMAELYRDQLSPELYSDLTAKFADYVPAYPNRGNVPGAGGLPQVMPSPEAGVHSYGDATLGPDRIPSLDEIIVGLQNSDEVKRGGDTDRSPWQNVPRWSPDSMDAAALADMEGGRATPPEEPPRGGWNLIDELRYRIHGADAYDWKSPDPRHAEDPGRSVFDDIMDFSVERSNVLRGQGIDVPPADFYDPISDDRIAAGLKETGVVPEGPSIEVRAPDEEWQGPPDPFGMQGPSKPEVVTKQDDVTIKPNPANVPANTPPGGAGLANDAVAAEKELNWLQQWTQDKLGWDEDKRSDISRALIAGGLATMAGESPYAMVNIGRGGLVGVDAFQDNKENRYEQERDRMEDERRERAEQRAEEAHRVSIEEKEAEIAAGLDDPYAGLTSSQAGKLRLIEMLAGDDPEEYERLIRIMIGDRPEDDPFDLGG